MNRINRNSIEKPECLKTKAQSWTDDFILKRQNNPKYWNWHKYKKEKVEDILANILSGLTTFHCSYCGISPLKQKVGGRSIDHFKPKAIFPILAFEWKNLFIACTDCQKIKGGKYPTNTEPLKPDSCHYHFDYWFEIDWTKNHIIPNKDRSSEEQETAQTTIDWLGLNDGDRPQARFDELEKYNGSEIVDDMKWSYPFFLERGKN